MTKGKIKPGKRIKHVRQGVVVVVFFFFKSAVWKTSVKW